MNRFFLIAILLIFTSLILNANENGIGYLPSLLNFNSNTRFIDNKTVNRKHTSQNLDNSSIFNIGIDAYNQGNYLEAIKYFTDVINNDPNNAEAYNYRGKAYGNLKNYEQAINDFTKAIELAPNVADYYYNRGKTYVFLENYEQAINNYTKAIELKPDFAEAYSERGFAYACIGEFEKAIRDANNAIELNPNIASVYKWRGAIFYIIGKYDEALADLNKAYQISPTEDILNLIALVQKEQAKQNTFNYDQCVNNCIEEGGAGIWAPVKDFCREYCRIRQAQVGATGGEK